MRFRFDDRKTVQAAAHLLKLHGGAMNYTVLIKLMYLADREMLLEHGMPITGDRMVSMEHGPALSNVYGFICGNGESEWFDIIEESERDEYEVKLRPDATGKVTDEDLSDVELHILGKMHSEFGHLPWHKLRDMLHDPKFCPEWENVGKTSKTIDPETVLRVWKRPQEEIDRVKQLAEEMLMLRPN